MILIADSGSSKTDWRIIDIEGNISQHRTVGFNPTYQTEHEMLSILESDEVLSAMTADVKMIYYYGAGCSSDKMKHQVQLSLSGVFPNAEIEVDHDLLAAARATAGDEPGIVSILGTGSNSCYYDGYDIAVSMYAPGFILGDEGGGSYVGKQFLKDFIHDEIPPHIMKLAIEELNLDYDEIIDRVYKHAFPGRYMASFCRFITKYHSDPYCYKLYYDAFQDFFKTYVMKFPDYESKKIFFVGSIAFYNSDILRQAAADLGLNVNMILEGPIAGLTLYHKSKL
ncbi:N-acetylglucosamine kinase [Belliella kenyensis]|uniref:N-acetylglucosamine kinase n=1 Tax=Belliella kenyensis TaxID=1472724 RepID=A0ABV8EHP8_9BACT|nr:N-acetylglucosamine kinase [Belliella kenyensis]MCH7402338.1 N-acetylglucosamine kinase [Belliella kenyensis]MDN3603530.1 N-acetylglucosamine kinase [Belliella kenyensis]